MSGVVQEKAGEDRVVLTDVSRALYQAIAASRGDRSVPRLTYSEGVPGSRTYSEHETSRNFVTLRTDEALDWLSQAETADQAAWSVEVENWTRHTLTTRPVA